MRINSNILALGAQRQLQLTAKAIARSIARLSSGKRLNSAQDGPSDLALSNRLETSRRGLLQAIQNINSSRGFLETAEGALSTQVELVQRMRELAIQAANGTLTSTDRGYLNTEVQKLYEEFNRLTTQTTFNGIALLDGSFGTKSLQVGTDPQSKISVSLASMQPSSVFYQRLTVNDGTFQARVSIKVGSAPADIATGDLNGDGYLDMIVTDGSGEHSVALGRADGTFASRKTLNLGGFFDELHVTAADLNSDGRVDLALSDASSGNIYLLLGNGNGTFQPKSSISVPGTLVEITSVDLNRDGKTDLLVADNSNYLVSIHLGNGDGTFRARTTLGVGGAPFDLNVADFNRDGILDIVTADSGDFTLSIALGNGDGTFSSRSTVSASSFTRSVISADFNNDGLLDLAETGTTDNTVGILLGNGNGTFKSRTTFTNPSGFQIIAGDFNGDDYTDLAATDQNGYLRFYFGRGTGAFTNGPSLTTGAVPQGIAAADINGDGATELIVSDSDADTVSLFVGNGKSKNITPSVNVSTQSQARVMLDVFSNALNSVTSARVSIGAILSRLDSAYSLNESTYENLSAAQSQIRDVDFAAETAEWTRLQILQQAQITVLTQANLSLRLSLKLLEGIR